MKSYLLTVKKDYDKNNNIQKIINSLLILKM